MVCVTHSTEFAINSRSGRLGLSFKAGLVYHAKESDPEHATLDITLKEQEAAWAREGKPPDIFVVIGQHVPSYEPAFLLETPSWLADLRRHNEVSRLRSSIDILLATLFYVELIGLPRMSELGLFHCQVQIRCRILPSSEAYPILILKLRQRQARFSHDYQSIPCVNKQLQDEADQGTAFSRRFEASIPSLQDTIDVQITGITNRSRSISNCPYKAEDLIRDQGLDCVFGNKDHKLTYFGSIFESRDRFI